MKTFDILATFLCLTPCYALAPPQPPQPPPSTTSNLIDSIKSQTNTTFTTPPLAIPTEIHCFEPIPDNPPIRSVLSCRPTINALRHYPNYKLRQPFREGENPLPRHPHLPPFWEDNEDSDCCLLLGAIEHDIKSYFSFADARAMAQEVLEYCEEGGHFGWGRGGTAAVGVDAEGYATTTWTITVKGRVRGEESGLDEVGGGEPTVS